MQCIAISVRAKHKYNNLYFNASARIGWFHWFQCDNNNIIWDGRRDQAAFSQYRPVQLIPLSLTAVCSELLSTLPMPTQKQNNKSNSTRKKKASKVGQDSSGNNNTSQNVNPQTSTKLTIADPSCMIRKNPTDT